MGVILETVGLAKEYNAGDAAAKALRGISFKLHEGDYLCILGPSGSGKSTLLNMIGGIDKPTSGRVFVYGKDLSRFSARKLTDYRRHTIGFVFQSNNLMHNLTTLENIELAARLSKSAIKPQRLLQQAGLADNLNSIVSSMSIGQQQRLAVAMAFVKNPAIILCDEPTGSLDSASGLKVLQLLRDLNKSFGKSIIIATHNLGIGQTADRVLKIWDGLIMSDVTNPYPLQPEEVGW